MTALMECILVLLILASFLLLGSSRLIGCIRVAAFQGFMVGLLPLVSGGSAVTPRLAALALLIAGSKGFVFPYFLARNLRNSNTSREVQPLVGYTPSVVIGVLFLVASFWLDSRLNLPVESASDIAVPVSFSMMMTGLFLIIARRTAINQVIGYLVLESGIYAFGLAIVRDIPVLVELGVLMDLFVAVFVMGIAIYRINQEFDHIDSDQLTSLKG
jgi:hydrogenase-4 component E